MIKKLKKHRIKIEFIEYIANLSRMIGSYSLQRKLYFSNGTTLYYRQNKPQKIIKFYYNRLDLKYREALDVDDIDEVLKNKHSFRYKVFHVEAD